MPAEKLGAEWESLARGRRMAEILRSDTSAVSGIPKGFSPGTTVSAGKSPAAVAQKSKSRLGKSANSLKRVRSKPTQVADITRERAENLAKLRRGWFDEFTWASLGGLAASLPGTAHAVSEITWGSSISMTFSQMVDLAVFLFFLALSVAALFRNGNHGPNSMQYLNAYFGEDPNKFIRTPTIIRVRKWFAARYDEIFAELYAFRAYMMKRFVRKTSVGFLAFGYFLTVYEIVVIGHLDQIGEHYRIFQIPVEFRIKYLKAALLVELDRVVLRIHN